MLVFPNYDKALVSIISKASQKSIQETYSFIQHGILSAWGLLLKVWVASDLFFFPLKEKDKKEYLKQSQWLSHTRGRVFFISENCLFLFLNRRCLLPPAPQDLEGKVKQRRKTGGR